MAYALDRVRGAYRIDSTEQLKIQRQRPEMSAQAVVGFSRSTRDPPKQGDGQRYNNVYARYFRCLMSSCRRPRSPSRRL